MSLPLPIVTNANTDPTLRNTANVPAITFVDQNQQLLYATRVYSPYDNVALLCWVALGNYPVIRGDRDKLISASG